MQHQVGLEDADIEEEMGPMPITRLEVSFARNAVLFCRVEALLQLILKSLQRQDFILSNLLLSHQKRH